MCAALFIDEDRQKMKKKHIFLPKNLPVSAKKCTFVVDFKIVNG